MAYVETRKSAVPDYWRFVTAKSIEHEEKIIAQYRSDLPFWKGRIDYTKAYDNPNSIGSTKIVSFLNWNDRTALYPAADVIFDNEYYLDRHYLRGLTLKHLFPHGEEIYKKVREFAKRMDASANGIKNNSLAARKNPQRVKEYKNIMGLLSRDIEWQDKNLREYCLRVTMGTEFPDTKGKEYPYTALEKFSNDWRLWTSTPESKDFENYRENFARKYIRRPGYVSNEEVLRTAIKGIEIIAKINQVFMPAAMALAGVLTAGAAAAALAPVIGTSIGVSTSVASTAIQGGIVSAATGGNPLTGLLPVGGEALKSVGGKLAPSLLPGGSMGLFDDLQKKVSGTLQTIGTVPIRTTMESVVSGVSNISAGSIASDALKSVSQLTPAQVANAVASPPVASKPVQPSGLPVSPAVKAAGIGGGALIALLVIFLLSQKKG